MTKAFAVLLLAMAACTGPDDGGTAGDGDDALPKRGELATDPTIVSATIQCQEASGPTVPQRLSMQVDASDPGGKTNLGSCALTVGTMSGQDDFYQGSCYVSFDGMACVPGTTYTLGLVVSNATGGVTTASVNVVATD
jgi:hypothetical protein